MGGFKVDVESVWVGLGLICARVRGLVFAVAFGLLQGGVMHVLGWFGIGCGGCPKPPKPAQDLLNHISKAAQKLLPKRAAHPRANQLQANPN